MTNSISLIAPAKLNLNLHVLNKDIDGYHFLKGINAHYHIMSDEDYEEALEELK